MRGDRNGVSCKSSTAVFLVLILMTLSRAAPQKGQFVDITHLDPTIVIDLPYATEDNFCRRILYPVERCFLRLKVAEALVRVQKDLSKQNLGLKVWDGYRPHSVQYMMWELSPLAGFVGDPREGSRHNRGAAVDVTLVDLTTGEELQMPTPYDEFSPRAHSNYIKIPEEVARNRSLLQTVMRKHGFSTISSEWWHFDHVEWKQFPLSDISIEELATIADSEGGKKTFSSQESE